MVQNFLAQAPHPLRDLSDSFVKLDFLQLALFFFVQPQWLSLLTLTAKFF